MSDYAVDKNKQTGFTIVELLIVIIVIGILAALILVAYSNVTNQAKVTVLQGDLMQASKQLALDRERLGGTTYPGSIATANSGNGLTPSSGNTYSYQPFPPSNPTSYCLTEVNGSTAYFIQSGAGNPGGSAGTVIAGTCLTEGLLGWWKLNGNATDSSSSGLNGSFSNGTPATTTGQNGTAGGAYAFTGQSITIPNSASQIGRSQFSISGWVKPQNNPASYNGFFGFRSYPLQNTAYMLQLQGTNNIECKLATSTGAGYQPVFPVVTPNAWQLLVMTYDGGSLRCYVNTTMSGTQATGTMTASATDFGIGVDGSAGNACGCSLDDVRFYGRALTTVDVQNLYSFGAQ